MKWIMFLRQFDPMLLPSVLLGNFQNEDGSGTWPFFVGATESWSKSKIIQLLEDNGIESWGWGTTITNDWMFSVRRSQANWAEFLMVRAGVPVQGRRLTVGDTEEAR